MAKRNSVYLLVVLFVIALLVYEVFVAKGETYYYTALGIILAGLIGFFLHFESNSRQRANDPESKHLKRRP